MVHIIVNDYVNEEKFNYIIKTLKTWFGSATFFFYDHGKYSFLCGDKK